MSTLKVLLRIPVSPNSGYGNDGIALALALHRAGVDVRLHPTSIAPPIPPTVAALLTKPLDAPFDVLINHVDPGQLECSPEAREACDTTVAWSMWEFSSLQNLKGKSSLRKRLKEFDALFGYSAVTSEAFKPYLTKETQAGTLMGGFDPSLWPYVERDWTSPRFSFLMHGQLGLRKDPWTAIQAFADLKEEYPEEFEPAEMHIHTTVPGLPKLMEEAIPKLRIHYETWKEDTVREFYKSGHVLISTSRGEGKNLPCLEMLSTGGSTIATNWSGHTNWMSNLYAYPLDYVLRPMNPKKYGQECLWAAADKEHLKKLMLECFRNRDEVKHKGELGSQVIPEMFNWDTVIESLFQRLGELFPERHLYFKFQEAKRELEQKRGRDV